MTKEGFGFNANEKINKNIDNFLIKSIKEKINKNVFFNNNKINFEWIEDNVFTVLDQAIEFNNLIIDLEIYINRFNEKEIKKENKDVIIKKFEQMIDEYTLKLLN